MHLSAVGSTAQTGRLRHAGVGAASGAQRANRLGCLIEYGEAALALGDREIARAVEDTLAPFTDHHATSARMAITYGPVHQLLGRLVALRGDLDAAVDHLDHAIADLTAFGAEPRLVRTRVALAEVLHRRVAPGDPERAADLQRAAQARADALDTPELLTPAEFGPTTVTKNE
jgi:hypothetical protein